MFCSLTFTRGKNWKQCVEKALKKSTHTNELPRLFAPDHKCKHSLVFPQNRFPAHRHFCTRSLGRTRRLQQRLLQWLLRSQKAKARGRKKRGIKTAFTFFQQQKEERAGTAESHRKNGFSGRKSRASSGCVNLRMSLKLFLWNETNYIKSFNWRLKSMNEKALNVWQSLNQQREAIILHGYV